MYPGVLMIYNLLYLKYLLTGDSSIETTTLESAFYEFQDILNVLTRRELEDIPNASDNAMQNLVFEEVLEEIMEEYPDLFDMIGDEISFANEDINSIFDSIKASFDSDITEIDLILKEYIHNIIIYRTLNLPIPEKDTQLLFTLNKDISLYYRLLAKKELEQQNPHKILKIIALLEIQLKSLIMNANEKERAKIKVCLAEYCNRCLSPSNIPNINEPW